MTAHNRRTFLASSAGLAAGAAFIGTQRGASAASPTGSKPLHGATAPTPSSHEDLAAVANSVLYVRDAATGTVVIMSGDRERVVVDPSLVAAIAGAGRK